MFGPKITTVFKSRWNALFWASSVLLTAYCSVPAENERSDADEVASLVAAANQHKAANEHRTNPWAKEAN